MNFRIAILVIAMIISIVCMSNVSGYGWRDRFLRNTDYDVYRRGDVFRGRDMYSSLN